MGVEVPEAAGVAGREWRFEGVCDAGITGNDSERRLRRVLGLEVATERERPCWGRAGVEEEVEAEAGRWVLLSSVVGSADSGAGAVE